MNYPRVRPLLLAVAVVAGALGVHLPRAYAADISVTLEAEAGQPTTVATGPVLYTVTFASAVVGFDAADVTLSVLPRVASTLTGGTLTAQSRSSSGYFPFLGMTPSFSKVGASTRPGALQIGAGWLAGGARAFEDERLADDADAHRCADRRNVRRVHPRPHRLARIELNRHQSVMAEELDLAYAR